MRRNSKVVHMVTPNCSKETCGSCQDIFRRNVFEIYTKTSASRMQHIQIYCDSEIDSSMSGLLPCAVCPSVYVHQNRHTRLKTLVIRCVNVESFQRNFAKIRMNRRKKRKNVRKVVLENQNKIYEKKDLHLTRLFLGFFSNSYISRSGIFSNHN